MAPVKDISVDSTIRAILARQLQLTADGGATTEMAHSEEFVSIASRREAKPCH